MVISMLKNWSHRYTHNYIIKFAGLMLIYYVINTDIVSYCMVSSFMYLGSFDILQV